MYILSERALDDDALFEDKHPITAVQEMISAAEYLINPYKNNDYWDRWNLYVSQQ